MAWHDESLRLLEPYVVGHYVAESDTVAHPEFARLSFAPASWQRLQELRQTYDPEGEFFDFSDGLG
jgi:hypothetical protein